MNVLYFSVAVVGTVILQLLGVQINSRFFFRLSGVCLFTLKDERLSSICFQQCISIRSLKCKLPS